MPEPHIPGLGWLTSQACDASENTRSLVTYGFSYLRFILPFLSRKRFVEYFTEPFAVAGPQPAPQALLYPAAPGLKGRQRAERRGYRNN